MGGGEAKQRWAKASAPAARDNEIGYEANEKMDI